MSTNIAEDPSPNSFQQIEDQLKDPLRDVFMRLRQSYHGVTLTPFEWYLVVTDFVQGFYIEARAQDLFPKVTDLKTAHRMIAPSSGAISLAELFYKIRKERIKAITYFGSASSMPFPLEREFIVKESMLTAGFGWSVCNGGGPGEMMYRSACQKVAREFFLEFLEISKEQLWSYIIRVLLAVRREKVTPYGDMEFTAWHQMLIGPRGEALLATPGTGLAYSMTSTGGIGSLLELLSHLVNQQLGDAITSPLQTDVPAFVLDCPITYQGEETSYWAHLIKQFELMVKFNRLKEEDVLRLHRIDLSSPTAFVRFVEKVSERCSRTWGYNPEIAFVEQFRNQGGYSITDIIEAYWSQIMASVEQDIRRKTGIEMP